MLTSEQEIQELADKIRPDQTLNFDFNILSCIESQNLKIEYTSEAMSSEVTGEIDVGNFIIKLAPLHRINASSTYCLAYFLGAALLFKKGEVISVSTLNNHPTIFYNENDLSLKLAAEHAILIFLKSFLMPKKLTTRLIDRLIQEFDIKDHRHGLIYLDYQECNHSQYVKIINNVCSIMNVSGDFAINRLTELEILNDVRLSKPKNWSIFVGDPDKKNVRDAKSPQRVNITIDRNFF